jgi:hypothetical protein
LKHAIYAPIFGDYGSPQRLVDLAVEAEASGYDGFFIWDHLVFQLDTFLHVTDPTIVLGAIACATSTLKIGTMVTPIARRRPWKLAKEMVSLDDLSNGRVILGVGLGEPADLEFGLFGEPVDGKTRSGKLREGLEVFQRLTRGEKVDFSGQHYTVKGVKFSPPRNRPGGVPIWGAATLPSLIGVERAVGIDGVFPVRVPVGWDPEREPSVNWPDWWLSAKEFAELMSEVKSLRNADSPFDAVASGRLGEISGPTDALTDYADAGATWWFEWVDERPNTYKKTLELVRNGPRAD